MNRESYLVETSNLYFKPVNNENIHNGWLDWMNANKTVKYLASGGKKYSAADLRLYLENITRNRDIFLAAYTKIQNVYIGNMRLYNISEINNSCWYGRLIGNTDYHGKGLGTEFLLAAEKYCLKYTTVRKLQTTISRRNVASLLSNIKAGMIVQRHFEDENLIYCCKKIK